MATNNIRFLEITPGNTQIQDTDWAKNRVIGVGLPLWEAIKENHGRDHNEETMATVVTKLSADGICGSGFATAGIAVVDIPFSRICPEASDRARFQATIDLMEMDWPRDTDIRNVSMWRDIKGIPTTRVAFTRSNHETDNTRDQDLFESLTGILVRTVVLVGAEQSIYFRFQIIPQALDDLRGSLLGDDGVPVLQPQCPSIPAITLVGKDTGLRFNGKGKLVPEETQDFATGSGMGVVPMLWSEGGVAHAPPPLAAIKSEVWNFLRRAVQPASYTSATALMEAVKSPEWPAPTTPSVQWPVPNPVQDMVNEGNYFNQIRYGSG